MCIFGKNKKADKCDIFFARVFQNIVKTLMKEITSVPGRINLGMSILLTFIIFIYILKTALESTSAAIARIFAKIEGPDDNSNIFVMFLIYTGFLVLCMIFMYIVIKEEQKINNANNNTDNPADD